MNPQQIPFDTQSDPQNVASNYLKQILGAPSNIMNSLSGTVGNLLGGVASSLPTNKGSGIDVSQIPQEAFKALLPRLSQFINQGYPQYFSSGMNKTKTGKTFQDPLSANIKAAQVAAPVAGELAPYALAGAGGFSPLGGALGGAFHGATTPNATTGQRLKDTALQGGTGALLGLLFQGIQNMLGGGPKPELGTEGNPIKMDIPWDINSSQVAQMNSNGGPLPRFMMNNAIPQMTQNTIQNSLPSDIQGLLSKVPAVAYPGQVENITTSITDPQASYAFKSVFDTALTQGNADIVNKLLPLVKPEYVQRFLPEIGQLLGNPNGLVP